MDATAWSPCASAAAWARPASLKICSKKIHHGGTQSTESLKRLTTETERNSRAKGYRVLACPRTHQRSCLGSIFAMVSSVVSLCLFGRLIFSPCSPCLRGEKDFAVQQ